MDPHKSLLGVLLSKVDAAQELHVTDRTLDRWHKLRIGPPRTMLGRKVYYRLGSLRDWVRDQEDTESVRRNLGGRAA